MEIKSSQIIKEIKNNMHSEEYERARKEFKNCLIMGIPGIFVPFYNAFKYWKPIMDAELKKEKEAEKESAD